MLYLTRRSRRDAAGDVWLVATVQGIRLGVAHWQLRHRTTSRR